MFDERYHNRTEYSDVKDVEDNHARQVALLPVTKLVSHDSQDFFIVLRVVLK